MSAAESRRGTALALLVAGAFFMENLDGTVITTAVPAMAASFGVAPVDLNVGVSAYLLALGVFIPVSGWVADRLGPRAVFAAAVAVFTFASLACGLADGLPAFVALRVLQGIGGAMMVPVGRLVVLKATPKERLIQAIAVLTWPALVAPVLGPPIGGFITTYASWRWIFYLNLPLGALAFALALKLVPREAPGARRPFDWPGFALTGAALFALMWTVEALGRPAVDWAATSAIAAAGLACLAAGLWHLARAEHPLVGLGALEVPTFAVTIWGGSLFRMSIGAVPFLLPLLFQLGFGLDAFRAGLLVIAVFAGNLAMKPLTTPILRRYGFRPVLLVNGLLNALAIGACALLGPETPVAVTAAVLFAGGLTRSMQFTAFNTIAFADVPKEEMSSANALFSTAFQLAMGLGVALGAIALRLGERFAAAGTGALASPVLAYRIAFAVVALVALASLWDSLRLAHAAGAQVSGRPARAN